MGIFPDYDARNGARLFYLNSGGIQDMKRAFRIDKRPYDPLTLGYGGNQEQPLSQLPESGEGEADAARKRMIERQRNNANRGKQDNKRAGE